MKTTAEIKDQFIKFFADKGHTVVDSASVVSNDKSLLFTVAGMVPFIPYFLGIEKPPYKRAVSVQKCIRTTDIENIGKTTKHGTFFQMNGNFSFGDYFKKEAIKMAWDFITLPWEKGGLGIEKDKILISVYEKDDESYNVWKNDIGVTDNKIFKRGMVDNYWSTGHSGPAGPDSEIFIDRGEKFGKEKSPYKNEERFVEIWNLVFTEKMRAEETNPDGTFEIIGDLKNKNIDTGMGLERAAMFLQNKDTIYEIDEIFPVIEKLQKLTGKKYGNNKKDDVHFRVISDHIRTALILISDGVRPSNTDRGYVLRRLLRRSIRSVKILGFSEKCVETLLEVSKNTMVKSYKNLDTDWEMIKNVATTEEEVFLKTLKEGEKHLSKLLKSGKLSGKDAFFMHDSFGFPIDLTVEIAAEKGISVNIKEFENEMAKQKSMGRKDIEGKKAKTDIKIYEELARKFDTEFVGYEFNEIETKVLKVINNEQVILEKTPFYAEKGGQIFDTGIIKTKSGAVFNVENVQNITGNLIVHFGKFNDKTFKENEKVVAEIDGERRLSIRKAHTAAHILYRVLKNLIGKDVSQAGSEVLPDKVRFDFHHNSKLSDDELVQIEREINRIIQEDYDVKTDIMPLDDAKKAGAVAQFDEKYGSIVRVLTIGDNWSKELCGGTHIDKIGKIGRFVFIKESSIGSGIRRVEALVGMKAYERDLENIKILKNLQKMTNSTFDEIAGKFEKMLIELKKNKKSNGSSNIISVDDLMGKVKNIRNTKIIIEKYENSDYKQALNSIQDVDVIILFNITGNNANYNIKVNNSKFNAKELATVIAKTTNGGAGGSEKFAQGGTNDIKNIDVAIEKVIKLVK